MIPFQVLLGCQTGIEPEGVKQLQTDTQYRRAWMGAHGIDLRQDKGGLPVTLDLRRLRKTYKSQQYLRAGLACHGPDTPADGEATGTRLLLWAFNTRQFRRTLAWHIAHQPFGVVAGPRQYKHAAYVIFEGYAGTSASGFADEVAADQTVAKLDYGEDLFHDWNEGGRSVGGAAHRVEAEFDRIRAEIGDLPGVVSSPTRLRAMLKHLTRTLHSGMLGEATGSRRTEGRDHAST